MADKIGGCECGAVTYKVSADNVHVYVCHCLNCQTRSGSAFAEHAMISASAFACDGSTVSRARESDGIRFEEVFCASCLSRIYNRNSFLPDAVFLRAGTLRRSQELKPIAHIWTARKQGWIVLPANVPSFEGSPTPEAFGAVIQAAEQRRPTGSSV